MPADYETIAEKAISFIQANLTRPITASDIAEAVFYSMTHLRRALQHVTGQGIRPNLIRLRMERAKQLLRQTELNVSEVGERVGYPDPFLFSNTFKRRVGLPPSEYRKRARLSFEVPRPSTDRSDTGPREWLYDDFEGEKLQPWWKPVRGKWVQENGMVTGSQATEMMLGLQRPLSENFRVTFETRVQPYPLRRKSELTISVWDQEFRRAHTVFVVGRADNTIGIHRRRGITVQWNPDAVLRQTEWHKVVFERIGVRSWLSVDEKQCFVYNDAFPPAYGMRCKLGLGAFLQTVSIRQLRIDDLGLEAYVPVVRQGDSLFNAELYDQALDFYMRHSRAITSAEDEAEFRYKIAMCHLRRGAFAQARQWFDRVLPLPENGFWARQANAGNLETERRERNWERYKEYAVSLFDDPDMRDRVRTNFAETERSLNRRGFAQISVDLASLLVRLEENGPSQMWWMAKQGLGMVMQNWNRVELAEKVLFEVVQANKIGVDSLVETMRALRMAYMFQGKIDQAIDIIERIRSTGSRYGEEECDIHYAIAVRAKSRFGEALKLMLGIAHRRDNAKGGGTFQWRHIIATLYAMGELDQAETWLEHGESVWAGTRETRVGRRGESFYPLPLLRGEPLAASEILKSDFKAEGVSAHLHAEQGVKAGILFELGDEPAKATEIWSEDVRRYPSDQVCFYADLAKSLIKNKRDNLEEMLYPPWTSSEMFYLVGLLMEKRGNTNRAMELFEMSVRMDPTNRWPSVWAKRKLRDDA